MLINELASSAQTIEKQSIVKNVHYNMDKNKNQLIKCKIDGYKGLYTLTDGRETIFNAEQKNIPKRNCINKKFTELSD